MSASAAFAQSPCADLDGDGFVAGAGCAISEDCNDQDRTIFPGATEVCNGFDDDCDGERDEGCNRTCNDFGLTLRVPFFPGGYDARLARADRSWAVIFNDNNSPQITIGVSRLGSRGQKLAEDRLLLGEYRSNSKVIWTGSAVQVGWDHLGYGPNRYGVFLQDLGRWGLESNPPSVPANDQAFLGDAAWSGYDTVLYWNAADGGPNTYFSSVSSQGDVVVAQGLLDTDQHSGDRTAWTGEEFGWAYDKEDQGAVLDVYFQRVNPSGALSGAEVRVTDHSPNLSQWGGNPVIASKGPGAGYGLCWWDNRTGTREVWCAILDANGNKLTPPGEFQVSNTATNVSLFSLAWNGAEFLLVWTDKDYSIAPVGKLDAARISAAGQILEHRYLSQIPTDGDPTVVWGGTSWGMSFEEWPTWPSGAPSASFAIIGCNCATDGDGDGIFPCSGGDCDDGDPSVGADTTEICTDGKDNDCDGLADCNDPDCGQGGHPPNEAAGLVFPDKTNLQWTLQSSANGYDVARGTLEDLRGMRNFNWTGCYRSRITTSSTGVPEDPYPGEGWYYLVRGRAKTCLTATWGANRDATLHGCP